MKLLIMAINGGGPAFKELEFSNREQAERAEKEIQDKMGKERFNWSIVTAIIEDAL